MIIKKNRNFDTFSVARFSNCSRYRYSLSRRWSGDKALGFIMLNPSTADEMANDPTIERCERRARQWQYGAIMVYNLFAFRATDPRDMKSEEDPVGPENNAMIEGALQMVMDRNMDLICGWGAHGSFLGRDREVLRLMKARGIAPMALEITKEGHPKHPLYISYEKKPIPFGTVNAVV